MTAAVATGRPVVALYVLDDETAGQWAPGGASRWWLHGSLAALERALADCGGRLVLRRGPARRVVAEVVEETAAEAVFFTRCYEPYAAALEADIADDLAARGVDCRRFGGGLLFEPETIRTKAGEPFRVFTPYYKACLERTPPKAPLPAPDAVPAPAGLPDSEALEDWRLLPTAPDWAGGLRAAWTPGEAGARARLDAFMDHAMAGYKDRRNRPDVAGTARLSPHLHFGEIGPRQVWHAAEARLAADAGGGESGARSFLRELVWREFSYHLLHHWPDLPTAPFRPDFAGFPWADDAAGLAAWQQGRTGYPIVDAGMRELWHTGWMHNRVRMITASFLVKDLMVPWQAGEAWFWDTLVDADLANNAASWQWVAGCGADAAPYFRIFNPVRQGEKFDPDGAYVRHWVPELAGLPAAYIHAPWTAPEDVLSQADVRLDESYPRPIVDHAVARRRALAAFQQIKKAG